MSVITVESIFHSKKPDDNKYEIKPRSTRRIKRFLLLLVVTSILLGSILFLRSRNQSSVPVFSLSSSSFIGSPVSTGNRKTEEFNDPESSAVADLSDPQKVLAEKESDVHDVVSVVDSHSRPISPVQDDVSVVESHSPPFSPAAISQLPGHDVFFRVLKDHLPKGVCNSIELIAEGYGQKPLCADRKIPPKCIIYSVGIGPDHSFETEMARRGCQVRGFDCTVSRKRNPAPGFSFRRVCLADHTGREMFGDTSRPVWSLCQMLKHGGHIHSSIHTIKIDCEGCEWKALEHFFTQCPKVDFTKIGQLLLEIHMSIPLKVPSSREVARMFRVFTLLEQHGFKVFYRRQSNGGPGNELLLPEVRQALQLSNTTHDYMGYELAFINTKFKADKKKGLKLKKKKKKYSDG